MLHYKDPHLICTPAGVALLKSSRERCRQHTVKPRSGHLITAGSSLIYTRNTSGPKMLPCGTPKVTGRASDNSFSQEVRCMFYTHELICQ